MDARTSINGRLPNRHVTARAIADESGIPFDGAEIFKKTPCVTDLKPAGRHVAKDMLEIGGIALLMKTLPDNSPLQGDRPTVASRTTADIIDAVAGNPNVKLTDAETAERKTEWKPRQTHHRSGALWKYAHQVGPTVENAVTHSVGRTRSSVMRIFRRTILALMLGATPVAAPGFAFDGAPANTDGAIPVAAAQQPGVAGALKKAIPPASPDTSLTALQYAAEGGHPVAQWKLGRMYASGDGVTQDDLRAFEYFSRIANAHAEDSPSAPQAAIVANAFVALGRYYLSGIPNSKIQSDPDRAREMFSYAASYFGNADAQYDLARLYLKSAGTSRDDFRYAARWLGLAAQKGQHQAQALLGQMLFNGDQLPRQAARGLMWLTLARDSAGPDEAWIKESYNKAIARASDDDRAMALQMLEHWVQGRRD